MLYLVTVGGLGEFGMAYSGSIVSRSELPNSFETIRSVVSEASQDLRGVDTPGLVNFAPLPYTDETIPAPRDGYSYFIIHTNLFMDGSGFGNECRTYDEPVTTTEELREIEREICNKYGYTKVLITNLLAT